jgi:MerR family transcriptional regulator/heat shock protein HspR
MNRPIISREQVAHELAVSSRLLERYESLGLVRAVAEGPEVGYEPAQIRRLWTIVSFQRDLGINLAGIELILQLCDRLAEVHRRVHGLADDLQELVELEESDSPTAPNLFP